MILYVYTPYMIILSLFITFVYILGAREAYESFLRPASSTHCSNFRPPQQLQ